MNDDMLDKQIIYIDSDNAIWNNATNLDFYIDILEPIKNALYITIIKSNITLDPVNNLNANTIIDLDPVYINLNDYKRLSTNINNSIIKCFEQITLNLTEKYSLIYLGNNIPTTFFTFSNNYITTASPNDSHIYTLNPIDPNLKRFNIKIYDKHYNILNRTDVSRFTMTICVYYNRKKLTMN